MYEPAGNVDWWKIVGDEPMLALVTVMGEVEFLGPAASCKRVYQRACNARTTNATAASKDFPMHDLVEISDAWCFDLANRESDKH